MGLLGTPLHSSSSSSSSTFKGRGVIFLGPPEKPALCIILSALGCRSLCYNWPTDQLIGTKEDSGQTGRPGFQISVSAAPPPLSKPWPAQVRCLQHRTSRGGGGEGGSFSLPFDSRSAHCLNDQHHFHTIITLANPLLILLLSCKPSCL